MKYFSALFLKCLLFLTVNTVAGQEGIKDTLFGRSYDELDKLFHIYFPDDTIAAKSVVEAYIAKARAQKDTVRIAGGFRYYADKFGPEMRRRYADSIIEITKNIYDKEYPGWGYILKGYWCYYADKYVEATENYLIANEYAVARNNIAQQVLIRPVMAALKNIAGKHKEALAIEKEHLYALENDPEYKKLYGNDLILEKEYEVDHMRAIYNPCLTYLHIGEPDSAKIYVRKGIEKCLEYGDTAWHYRFVSTGGVAEYYDGNYRSAIDSFAKAIPHLKNKYTYTNAQFYKGRSYEALGRDREAMSALKKADSLVELMDYRFPELRPGYEYMIAYYETRHQSDSQLIYIDKLLKLDEKLLENRSVDGEIARKYDTPKLLRQKEKLISDLERKNDSYRKYKLLMLIAVVLLSILLAYYYQRQRIYKKRYRELLLENHPETPDDLQISVDTISDSGVPEETFRNIEEGLIGFEKEKRFTDPEVSLHSLAKELQTNSTYLSRVINATRKMNFSKYLQSLRMDHIIQRLKNEKRLRSYSIQSIAGEAGYNTAQSFAASFYQYTGIYPSYFVKRLREEKFVASEAV